MTKISKKRKDALSKYDSTKTYSLKEASSVIKEISNVNFDSSIDLAVRLGVDPRKADQNVRGVVTLPNGTGKDVKVLALVTPDKEKDALDAGADFVGLDEFLQKIPASPKISFEISFFIEITGSPHFIASSIVIPKVSALEKCIFMSFLLYILFK